MYCRMYCMLGKLQNVCPLQATLVNDPHPLLGMTPLYTKNLVPT